MRELEFETRGHFQKPMNLTFCSSLKVQEYGKISLWQIPERHQVIKIN
jgi:hypothetical protein